MNRSRNSLFGKLFARFLLFAVVIVLILWCMQSFLLDDIYKLIKTRRADTALDATVSCLGLDDDAFADAVHEIASYYDVCIMVFNERFEVLVSAESEPRCVLHSLHPGQLTALYAEAANSGGVLTDRWELVEVSASLPIAGGREQHFVTENIVKLSIVRDDAGQERIVFINSLISPLHDTVETLQVQLLWFTAVVLLLALVLAAFLSRALARPIAEIGREAAKLADGRYDLSLPDTTCRELRELSDTLTYAAGELAGTERLRRELIANVSHDLRTPLTAIGGTAELMLDFPEERTEENLRLILSETSRLTRLVADVMDLSKVQSGADAIAMEPLCLTELVRDVTAPLAAAGRSGGYTVTVTADGELYALGDAPRLVQVVQNLVANAINYLGDGSEVEVTVRDTGDGQLRVEVRDDGEGIAEEDLPYIFERYYRSDRPHKRSSDGSGLGLSIVKSILDAHGSAFGVMSSPGAGSTFWFTLPRWQPPADEER